MRNKIALASIAAALLLGSMQTDATASSCSGASDGHVSCDQLDLFTLGNAVTAANAVPQSALAQNFWDMQGQAFVNLFLNSTLSMPDRSTISGTFYSLGWGIFLRNTSALSLDTDPGIPSLSTSVDRSYNITFTLLNGVVTAASAQLESISARMTYLANGISTTANATQNQRDSWGNNTSPVYSLNVAAVPGPEAGAGVGAFTLGGLALYLSRRRQKISIAA